MPQILDLHIHSRYSRACSRDLVLPKIEETCRVKGVDVIATGDFTHPVWFSDIEKELEEIDNSGLYKLKTKDDLKVKFILSTEISLIYKKGGRARRIHLVVHAPRLSAVRELNEFLSKGYNIKSDGRPILGMSAPDLVKLCLKIDPKFLIYPAHIWTPWFSVFGSKSGFDSMEECFEDFTKDIYALETGLSSDPEMNWRLSALDRLTIISNSDAHSLTNIAREANAIELDKIVYDEVYRVIKDKDLSKLKYTIEFYPEEGMYHYDGHRVCGVRLKPEETRKKKNICPVCGKELTVGVLNRVEELADRAEGFRPENSVSFKKLVELDKIIAEAIGVKSRQTASVAREYDRLTKTLGSELKILLETPFAEIRDVAGEKIAEAIKRTRAGKLEIDPGFDGQYGTIRIFSEKEKAEKQPELF